MGETSDENLYLFCENNTIINFDLLGLSKSSSDYLSAFFDDRGWEIFSHWLNGKGQPLIFEDTPRWSSYMKANEKLKPQLQSRLKLDASKRFLGELNGVVDLEPHVEIENGYTTGYEMLHGPNWDVGGFTIKSDEPPKQIARNGECAWAYDVVFTWHDLIDPNKKYLSDSIMVGIIDIFSDPEDYYIEISWSSSFEIRREGGRLEGYGYPYDNELLFWTSK